MAAARGAALVEGAGAIAARSPRWLELLNVVPRTAAFLWSAGGEQPGRALPRLSPYPGTVLSVLLDDLFATFHFILTSASDEDLERGLATLRQVAGIASTTSWLDDPASFHPAPAPPADVARVRRRWLTFGFEHVRFTSGHEIPAGLAGGDAWRADAVNHVVHAYVLRHDDRPRPWLVALHPQKCGTAIDLQWMGSLGLFHELGVNVVHPVLPLHGPRAGSATSFPCADGSVNLYAARQAVADARSVIAWARAEGATAIGVHGLSLGGYVAAMLAGLEPELDCVVAGIPLTDIPGLIAGHMRRYRDAGDHAERLLDLGLRPAHRLISPLALTPRVPRERLFIYAAVGDRVTTPDQAHDLWLHWDRPAIHWYQGAHVMAGMSRRLGRFVRDALVRRGVVGDVP